MSSKKHSILVLAALCGCVVFGSIRIFQITNTQYARIPGEAPSNAQSIKRQLDKKLISITTNDLPTPGGVAHLLTLRTAAGSDVDIFTLEGELNGTSIDPANVWGSTLVGSSLILNSVDEVHRNNGGISELIAAGCHLLPREGDPAQLGDLDISQCNGSYSDNLKIRWVGNAAVIIFEGFGDKDPCGLPLEESEEKGYSECIAQAIQTSLDNLFNELRTHRREVRPQTIIIPAIGTGVGSVSKQTFYQTLKSKLLEEVQQPGEKNVLPERIILQVWRGETPEQWVSARTAIANFISELSYKWNVHEHGSGDIATLAGMVGVAGTLVLILAMYVLGIPYPRVFDGELKLLRHKPVVMVVLGWGLASLGFLSGLRPVAKELIGSSSVAAEITFGVVAVLVCGVLRRALDALDEPK